MTEDELADVTTWARNETNMLNNCIANFKTKLKEKSNEEINNDYGTVFDVGLSG